MTGPGPPWLVADPSQPSRQVHGPAPECAHRKSSRNISPNTSTFPPLVSSFLRGQPDPAQVSFRSSAMVLAVAVYPVSSGLFVLPQLYILCMSQGKLTPSAAQSTTGCTGAASTQRAARTHIHTLTNINTVLCKSLLCRLFKTIYESCKRLSVSKYTS